MTDIPMNEDLLRLRKEVMRAACQLEREDCNCDYAEGAAIAFNYLYNKGYIQ